MQVVIVYNPLSGSAQGKPVLRKMFRDADIKVIKFIDITKENFHDKLQPYTQQTKTIIVGIGGDGTLSSIAAQLVGTKAIFAPLPGGTLNHFTKDLGIDQDLSRAIHNLSNTNPHKVDVAQVNERVFLNNSSIGLYPSSLNERSKLESRIGKWPAAVVASARAFIKFRLYTVTLQGETYKTPFVFIGNNFYDADSLMRRESIDTGKLSVYMISSSKRMTLLKAFAFSMVGRSKEVSEVQQFKVSDVDIQVNKKTVRISFDGESTNMPTPLHYKILEKSLNVLG